MNDVKNILKKAHLNNQSALSEYESKMVLSAFDIPIVPEMIVGSLSEAKTKATNIGYPVVLKLCAPEISHKSEMNLIEINLRDDADLERAYNALDEKRETVPGDILLQKMISGKREYVMGLMRDPVFGPCVMFGMGGIFTEMLQDVAFRVAPLSVRDAQEMMNEIFGSKTLGAVRGMSAVDTNTLTRSLISMGTIGLEYEDIKEIDVNPLIVDNDGRAVAVDALIVL